NSYISVNNLPTIFSELAKSGGHPIETGMSAPGGWTLANHAASSDTINLLESSKWNYVVLQEQSQIPAVSDARLQQMYPAARTLISKIREVNAVPILFITWAHRDGWPEGGFNNYESMQANINQGYWLIAQEQNVITAPAGIAWSNARTQDP